MDIVLFILRILIVVALYTFLGVVLFVLLREQRPGQALPPQPAILTRLDANGESAQGASAGASYQLALHGPTWIGRDPNCAVRVDNELVSLRHARLEWRADKQAWWIEDNSSRNGTVVNDERVMQCEIDDQDTITIGHVTFRFQSDGKE
jgi:pSer/pThr/pTyr-binding forkhead associated (FHA) protein